MENREQLLRVFLDSNVLIAGLVFPRRPYEILKYGETQSIRVVVCPLVIEEVQARITASFPDYASKVSQLITTGNFEIVSDPSKSDLAKYHNLVRDKKDIPIALAAIKANVHYLVTSDKDLTAQDATTQLLRTYIQPLLPGTFLKQIMGWTSEELEAIRYRTWKDIINDQDENTNR